MQELEERIRRQGTVKPGNVLKVDAFLNHQCDVRLFDHMGAEWARLFAGHRIDKILTIEASGIGIACLAARHFGDVPVVFAKKTQSKRFLKENEHVLILDDFLAKGNALHGLIDICHDAKVVIEGIGIAVEKGFQEGGSALREEGYNLKSLAIVESMDPDQGTITFAHNPA